MQLHAIEDSFGDLFWGSWTDKAIAERILKIIQMGVDDGAKLVSLEINDCAEQLKAGLLPYKIEVIRSVATGAVLDKPKINLTWPPSEEGIVEEREDYIRYFFWAKTQAEATRKLSTVKRSGPMHIQVHRQEAF